MINTIATIAREYEVELRTAQDRSRLPNPWHPHHTIVAYAETSAWLDRIGFMFEDDEVPA